MPPRVVYRVPSSTTNFGPGFDTLGAALAVPNLVEAELTDGPREIAMTGRDAERFADEMADMAHAALAAAFGDELEQMPGFRLTFRNRAPVARGLGSSATLRQGVVAAVGELVDRPVCMHRLLTIGTRLEGHPDNVVPTTLGGLAVCARLGEHVVHARIEIDPALAFVAAVPDIATYTDDARQVLPTQLALGDAVHNLNRCSMLVALMAQRRYDELGPFFDDRIHQPFRSQLVPGLFEVIDAAREAGAIGGFLSGSGSTVMALTLKDPGRVAAAMVSAFARAGQHAEAMVLAADNRGLERIE